MIGFLKGELISSDEGTGIILTQSGVGYTVRLPENGSFEKGGMVELFIHTHLSESQIQLFGFSSKRALDLFKLLLKVSGVGPGIAHRIATSSESEDILRSIALKNDSVLRSIHKVGKKTALRICSELSDVAMELLGRQDDMAVNRVETDLVAALRNLGYQDAEIREGLKIMKKLQEDGYTRFEDLLKAVITHLSGRR